MLLFHSTTCGEIKIVIAFNRRYWQQAPGIIFLSNLKKVKVL